MDKQQLKNELLIEIMSTGTSDIKLLQTTIDNILVNYGVTRYKDLLPSTGDGSTTKFLFEEFSKAKMIKCCSKKTLDKYLLSCQKLFSFVKKELNLVTKDDIYNYLTFYKMGGENYVYNYKEVSDSTVVSRYRDLNSFYTFLFDNKYIAENPMTGITPPKAKIRHGELIAAQKMEKIIISCENHYKDKLKLFRNTSMVTLLIETGVRNGELCNIKIGDIDFTKNRIFIPKGKGNKFRRVYFGDRTKERLYAYLKLRGDVSNDDYLFTHYYKNVPLKTSGVESIINQIGEISNIGKMYPHLFRKSFATKLIDNGINPMVVKELMGHSSLETLNNYVSMTDDMIKDSIRIAFC